MKTNKMENKMKTLNKKNLECINELIYEINRDKIISENILKKKGKSFYIALTSHYDIKLNTVKLFEEFGICLELKGLVDDWRSRKDELQKSREDALTTYNYLSEKSA